MDHGRCLIKDPELTGDEWRTIGVLVPRRDGGWDIYRPGDERPFMTHSDRQFLIFDFIDHWKRTC